MSSPGAALLKAMIGVLRTDAGVAAAHEGGRPVSAWESSPTRAAGLEDSTGYPLIEIPTIQEIGGERIGGQDSEDEACVFDPIEAFADVHVYSRIRGDGVGGKPEAMNIAHAARRALARELALEGGYRVTLGEYRDMRHFNDPGPTAHSVLTLRYLIHPSED